LSGTKDGLSLGGVPRRKHPGRAAPPSLKGTHFFEVKSGVSNILSFAPELDRAGSVWGQIQTFDAPTVEVRFTPVTGNRPPD
jgi:hypothetical protein